MIEHIREYERKNKLAETPIIVVCSSIEECENMRISWERESIEGCRILEKPLTIDKLQKALTLIHNSFMENDNKVLIIDDEPFSCSIVTKTLKANGIMALSACNAQEVIYIYIYI